MIASEFITISPFLSGSDILSQFCVFVKTLVESTTEVSDEFEESWANRTYILGRVLRFLAAQGDVSKYFDTDLRPLLRLTIRKWAWSEYAMAGIAQFTQSW